GWRGAGRRAPPRAGPSPAPAPPPAACRFHTRCPYVQPTRCREEIPPLRKRATGHEVACHWAEDIQAGRLTPHARETVLAEPAVELSPSEEPPPGLGSFLPPSPPRPDRV